MKFSLQFADACEKIKCKFGSTCKNGRCTCPTYCDKQSEHDDLLCASNGRTFANDCDLKRYACLHQVKRTKFCSSQIVTFLKLNLNFEGFKLRTEAKYQTNS